MKINFSSPLVNLAILETLKSRDVKDEIDLFLPIVSIAISELNKIPFGIEDIHSKLKEMFSIKIPIAAIHVIIARAKNRGLVRVENHTFLPCTEQLEKWREGYTSKKEKITESLSRIRLSYIEFAKTRYNKTVSEESADLLIYKYLSENLSSTTLIAKKEIKEIDNNIKNKEQLTAAFIANLHSKHKELWKDLEIVVKGVLLANYLSYADQISKKKSYTNVVIYLDTPIIIGILGFSGTAKEKVLIEMVEMLNSFSVELRVFDITFRETENVLLAWKTDLEQKRYEKFNPKTIELLRQKGIDGPGLETHISLLEKRLKNLNINVKRGFKLEAAYSCDQKGLEKIIKRDFIGKYVDPEHDATAIARIHNSRKGKLITSFDKEFGVFVTPNRALVSIGEDFFKELQGTIPYAVTDRWLTTMFWFKHPEVFKDLPSEILLSTAYSTLFADDRFWHAFSRRLDNLAKNNKITNEEFLLVRYDSSLLSRVHEASVDKGTEFTDSDVFDLVEEVKNKYKNKNEQEIKTLTVEKNIIQNELSELKASIKRSADILSGILSYFLCGVLLLAISYTVVFFMPENLNLDQKKQYLSSVGWGTIPLLIAYVFASLGALYSVKPIHAAMKKEFCALLVRAVSEKLAGRVKSRAIKA